jgi:hypothetical protein
MKNNSLKLENSMKEMAQEILKIISKDEIERCWIC